MKILGFVLSMVKGQNWICSDCGWSSPLSFNKCGKCGKPRTALD
jgi:ribosomal protein L40E